MSGSSGNEDDALARETEGTDREALDSQAPFPPEPVEPFYQKLEYELLLGEPEGREAESGEKEREAPPALRDLPNSEAPPGLEGPQTQAKPPGPEGLQQPEDAEGERQGREEDRRPELTQNHREKEGIGGLPSPKRGPDENEP